MYLYNRKYAVRLFLIQKEERVEMFLKFILLRHEETIKSFFLLNFLPLNSL